MQAFAKAHLLSLDGDLDGSMHALEDGIAADPDSAELQMALAEVQLQRGDVAAAQVAMEQALKINPELDSGYSMLGEILLAREDYAGAASVLTQANARQPADSKVMMRLAYALARTGETDKALQILRTLVANEPDNLNALLVLARFYRSSDLPQMAAETYRVILERAPESGLVVAELADLEAGRQHIDAAEAICLDYLALVPDDTGVRHRLVRIYLDAGRYDDALAQLETILETDDADQDAQRKIGLIHMQRQDWSSATKVFATLLANNPENSLYRYDLAVTLEAAGDKEGALAAFAGIDAESELYPDALMHRAYLLYILGRAAEAQKLMGDETDIVLTRPEAVVFLASLYIRDQKFAAAEALLRQGQELFPDHAELLQNLALLLDQRGQFEEAETLARRVMELDPQNADAPNLIAYSLAERNMRLDEALSLAQQALSLDDAPHIRDTLGWVYYRLGRFSDARVELELAAQALDHDPVVLEHLGDVLQALGDSDAAVNLFRRALETGKAGDPESLQRKIGQPAKRNSQP